ncbi:MAG TPA: phosphate ABC transporter permease PstA [Thermomicrobiales bacterium]|nr:phosphate ABC transporter permease PstA [Thermomicrobiales bacterium]
MSSQALPPRSGSLAETGNLRRRQRASQIGRFALMAATLFAVVALGILLWYIVQRGWGWLSWGLLMNPPSRKPERAGLSIAISGTLWIISLTLLVAFPMGVASAIYLEEYAPKNRWTRMLQINISNLAGVPSVVYGLLGLGIFVQWMGLGRVVLSGALTMALLSLPVIIISSQEALRAVPPSLREAAYGVGATRWQVTASHVLPAAIPGIMTGVILAVSRAIGETAPLLVVGAAGFLTSKPSGFTDSYTTIPIQLYNWMSRPQAGFRDLAAAGIIVLLALLISMNLIAIVVRQHYSSKTRW